MYLYPYPSYRSFYIHQSILIYLFFLEKRLPSYFLEEQAICTEEKQKKNREDSYGEPTYWPQPMSAQMQHRATYPKIKQMKIFNWKKCSLDLIPT